MQTARSPPVVCESAGEVRAFLENPVPNLLKYGHVNDVTRMRLPGWRSGTTEYYVVSDPEVATEVLESPATERPNVRQHLPLIDDGYLSDADGQWEHRRAAFVEGFSGESLVTALNRMSNRIMTDITEIQTGPSHDLSRLTRQLALNPMVEAIVNRPATDTAHAHVSAAIDAGVKCGKINYSSLLPIWAPRPAFVKFWRHFAWLYQWTDELADDAGPDSIARAVLAAGDFPRNHLPRIIRILVTAGVASTSVMLGTAICLLDTWSSTPELRDSLSGFPVKIGTEDVAGLPPDFRWVLLEALRLFPPTFNLARVTTDDLCVGGYVIPNGSDVWIDQWSIGRHPDYWENPNVFDPSRWDRGASRDGFHPFGAGPRACFGRTVALREGELILANLLKQYEIHGANTDLAIADQDGRISTRFDDTTLRLASRR